MLTFLFVSSSFVYDDIRKWKNTMCDRCSTQSDAVPLGLSLFFYISLEKSTRLGNSSFLSFNNNKKKRRRNEEETKNINMCVYVKRTNQHVWWKKKKKCRMSFLTLIRKEKSSCLNDYHSWHRYVMENDYFYDSLESYPKENSINIHIFLSFIGKIQVNRWY